MNTTAQDLIKVENVHKSFMVGSESVEILKGINISIKKGEFTIIFGPSGCGKSTLLHTLLGLEEPTSGKVTIEDKDFYSMNEDERARFRKDKVGMIYQQSLWVNALNVIENVMFPLHLLNLDEDTMKEKAMKALEDVSMQERAYFVPAELSSGQQQKISLARAVTKDPVLIVADEPTGNLDSISSKELLETFLTLVSKGVSIIMVTHDMEHLQFANRVFHMLDGEVVEEYQPHDKNHMVSVADGKKKISDNFLKANVRDRDFLKKMAP
jgi:ABC-type lipoprotein export system ATPase subunit